MTEEKYYCRICGTEMSKERYEDHDELCDFCEQNEEDDEDEDFGIARARLVKEHFSKKPLKGFVALVKRRELERTFAQALWSKQKYGRRLFAKLSYWAI